MAVLDKMEIQLTGDVSQLKAAMAAAEQAMRQQVPQMQRHLQSLERSFGTLKTIALSYISVDFAAHLYNTGKAALQAAGDLAEMAEQAGVTTDELQILVAAGVQAGAKVEDITAGMGRFSKSLATAATEGGSAAAAFNKLGVATRDSSGGVRDTMTALVDTAEAISKIESPAQRIQAAMEIFGRGGAKLVPILSQGREGIERFADQARKMGLVLDRDMVKAADEAADKMALLDLKSQRLNETIAAALMPTFVEWTVKLKEWLAELVRAPSAVEALQSKIEDLEHTLRRQRSRGGAGSSAIIGEIARLQAQMRQAQWAVDNQGIPVPKATDKGLMSPNPAMDKFMLGLSREATLAGMSGVEREIEAAQYRAQDVAAGANGTLGAKQMKDIAELIRLTREKTDATKRREEAEKRLGDALDAEDASMGVLLKTQREMEAKKYSLVRATDDEIKNNEKLLGALQQSEEAYRIELALQRSLAQAKRDGVEVTEELTQKFREQAAESGRQSQQIESLKDSYEDARRSARDFFSAIESGFERAIFAGEGFRSVISNLGSDIARHGVRSLITNPLGRIVESATGGPSLGPGGAGGIFSLFGNLGTSVAGSALSSALGLPSIGGSIMSGLGGLFGGGAAAAGGIAATGTAGAALGIGAGASGAAGIGAMGSLAAALGPALSVAGPAALAVGAGFALSKLFGGKPSVGPGGGSGVMFNGSGVEGRFLNGDNGYSGGQTLALASRAADALNQLAQRLGTTVTPAAQGAFGEGQGKLWFGLESDPARPQTTPENAVSDYLKFAIERGALAGITSVDESLIAGAVGGKLEAAMAQLEAAQLVPAIDSFIRQAERFAEGMDRLAMQISDTVDALKLDSNLSPFDGRAQLEEANRQYGAISAAARAGDPDALARLPGAARNYLSLGQDFYARSSENYRRQFAFTTNDLSSIGASTSGSAASARSAITELGGIQSQAMVAETVDAVRALADRVDRLTTLLRNQN